MNGRVIVVGAGASGLFAAGKAAEQGATVLLLEKMDRPGRKLGITGKGRCNLTNVASLPEFIEHFGANGSFLRQCFSRFFTPDLIAFLDALGIATVTERGGRVFPASEDAGEVVDGLVRWVTGLGVNLETLSPVGKLLMKDERIAGVQVSARAARNADRVYSAESVVIATGGKSYPGTGSTGDGYRLAESVGHTIMPLRPGLVPLETAGEVASRLQGLALRNVTVRLRVDEEERTQAFGEMLFTHFGLSGPIVLTLSKQAVDGLRDGGQVSVSIDLKPALDDAQLDARLLRDIDTHGKRHVRTLLKGLLPSKLVPVCADLTGLTLHKECHQITAEERGRLRSWLKDFRLHVTGHRPFSEAIVTAGGVDLAEVDPYTLTSRLVEGLFFAGEVLDIDADTGGYNLQAAFSTGWVAGSAAARPL